MTLSNYIRKFLVLALGLVSIVLLTACGTAEPAPTVAAAPLRGEMPELDITPEVEYGASLSDWEEATQNDEPQASSQDAPTNPPAPTSTPEPTATPIPAADATSASADTASSTAATDTEEIATSIGIPVMFSGVEYQEILWDGLVPPGFSSEDIFAKYAAQLAEFEDGSEAASELYSQMQEEFDNAPANEGLNDVAVRIPGFITPLEYTDNTITEFLLVPYFGACIHTPPPPSNQTVLVTMADGQGIKIEDSYNPIWVMGVLEAETIQTDLAAAGYNIGDAIIEPYVFQAP